MKRYRRVHEPDPEDCSENGMPAAAGGKWIQGAIKHPGALRAKLGVKAGEKIPTKKLNKAAYSSNPTTRKQANLAKTLKSFH